MGDSGMTTRLKHPDIGELSERSREIFRQVVEAYVSTGAPVGSHTLSRRLPLSLSPASVRNAMGDLEDLGLLYAPHTSAGRLPTEMGLRLFVDGLLEVGELDPKEQETIARQCTSAGHSLEHMLEQATGMLSGLSHAAGMVLAPKTEAALKHVELVPLGADRALAVLVTERGIVENRVMALPEGLPVSALEEATNYLNARVRGRTLADARDVVQEELQRDRAQLNELAHKVVEAGLATWSGTDEAGESTLIVRGQAHLLDDVTALEDLERIRGLFEALETKETILRFVDLTARAEGVQIFIGAENNLFNVTGCSMVVAPFRSQQQRIVGAIGVIGPTRLNYGRIIPLVDYTSKVIGSLLSSPDEAPTDRTE